MAGGDGEPSSPSSDSGESVALEAIPQHSTNLLTLLDDEGVIKYESPAIERVFGFDQDELVGDSVAQYIHPEDRDRVVGAFETAVSGDEFATEAVEYRHERADGTYCWVESVTSTEPTPEGYYVVNTRDISASKAREQQLEDANERLEEFASVLSHDLRNPLQVARGRLELADENQDGDHLTEIERALDRMQTLIEDLHALARDGEGGDDREPVDVHAVSTDCWRNVDTADATLDCETTRVVSAERSRFQQLLENLFRNAVEHGGTDVTVTVGDVAEGFHVSDDGVGIPEDARDDVFDPDYSTGSDGTGIGLRIVEEVATAHDWDVEVMEGPDGGTRVEVTGDTFE